MVQYSHVCYLTVCLDILTQHLYQETNIKFVSSMNLTNPFDTWKKSKQFEHVLNLTEKRSSDLLLCRQHQGYQLLLGLLRNPAKQID